MMNYNDLIKIKPPVWSTILTIFIIVSSGALLIFVFDRDLFLSLDIFKLGLLSFAGVLPIFLFNAVICYVVISQVRDIISDTKVFTQFIIIAGSIPIFLIYAIILQKIFSPDYTVEQAFKFTFGFESMFLIYCILKYKLWRKK